MRFVPLTRVRAARQGPPPVPVTLHAQCAAEAEAKVRALCILTLTSTGAHLLAFDRHPQPDGTVLIRVTLAVDGPGAWPLEELVGQLSREPAVRGLRWRQETGVT
ncbi:hypothetical protein [Streptomyces orinoci]|uniref:MgtC-like C-terminal domain-containing protein n=1 Tax=Streptomyces orinoci TaxID=67339 RepID=A0ABV3K1I5_STRON|nr:hypothetical protein [Streptomyces orinoci]